ncbi:MAG TPA: 3'-5' exonuclease [Longimicrobiales bacterium]|nr:3'-5' exonuclease [Longimicrobiales bacterium]
MARRKRKRELSELLPELQLDLSARSQHGIKICLKHEPPLLPVPETAAPTHLPPASKPVARVDASLPLAPEPVRYSGIKVVNGKVIREGRHTESQWNYIGLAGAVPLRIHDYAPDVVLERRADVDGVVRLLPIADTPGEPLEQLEYVVVDVETTGVGAGHRITEVAIVRVNGRGRVLDDWTTLVNPQRPIPAWITTLTSINGAMVRSAPRFREIAEAVHERLNGRIFVAHNAGFDWRFLSMELQLALGTALRGRMLCTVRLARKLVPEVSRRSLDSLSWYFGVPNEARHRAYGDARATAKVFARMLDRVAEREIAGWNELQKVLYARSGPRKRRAMPQAMEPTP